MEIEWDNNKAASNLIKHKIDFEDAKNIFLDPNRLEREDKRDYDETRIQVIGIVNQVVLFVVYTKKTAKIILFQQGEPIRMNNDNITRVKLDPKNVSHGKTDWEKVEAMTEEDIIAVFSRMRGNKILERFTVQDFNTPHSCDYRYNKAAEADSDCLPLSQKELNEFRRISIQVPIL